MKTLVEERANELTRFFTVLHVPRRFYSCS